MGRNIDEEAFVIQMEQELAGTLYFDDALMRSLEAAHQDPALSADDLREVVINIIATTLQPWSRSFVAELKKQVLEQVAAAYDKAGWQPIIRQGPSGPAFRTRARGALGTTGHTRSQ